MQRDDGIRSLVSATCSGLSMSAIKQMAILSAGVPGASSLAWGLPSFQTPMNIRSAVDKALADDPRAGMYTLPAGLPELRDAAASNFTSRFGRATDPDRNIVISSGNMDATNTIFSVLLNPGDEVIVTDPGFVSHIQQVTRLQGFRFSGRWMRPRGGNWMPLDFRTLSGRGQRPLFW